MSLLPDPADLLATADRISRHADALRARSSRLALAAADARWESPAARAFRVEVDGLGRHLRLSAGRIDDAADTLRRHARRIEHELAMARLAAHEAERLAAGAARGVESITGGALVVAHSALSMVGL